MRIAMVATDNREHFRQYDDPRPVFGTAPEALLQGFSELGDIEVHVLSCTQKPLASPCKLASNIWYHSLHVPKLGWLRTGYQGCIRAVRKKLREIQPQIVHGQGTERECGISAVLSGYPSVVTIHGNMAELARLHRAHIGSYLWCAARLEGFTLRRARAVFCNSEYTESLVKVRTQKTFRVANAVRREFFDTPRSGGSSFSTILLNIGVISPRKRQVELLEFARELHGRNPIFKFHFVGKSADDAYAREFFDRIKDRSRYGFAEYTPSMDTASLIGALDTAAALIHFPFEEAFGLVVAEALSRSTRVFGTKTGGIVDIAAGVPGAQLFAADDWEGLGYALGEWMTGGFAKEKESAQVMRSRYQPRVIAEQHLEIYRGLISH
jgi:glycosyltransferase involved in cell wall biosynthesis